MRKTATALAAALAMMVAGAAPATACEAYAAPCSPGVFAAGDYYYRSYTWFERLPDPAGPPGPAAPRYYYVNQGPYYSGPGMYAPVPTYQESAVTGWHGYDYARGPLVYRHGRWVHRPH